MNLQTLFKTYNLERKGLIHIGGEGAEIPTYIEMGFGRVLIVQPDHEKFQSIMERIQALQVTHVLGARCAVLPKNGYAMIGEKLTPGRTLDTLLIELGVHPREFNTLVIDVTDLDPIEDSGEETFKHLDAIAWRFHDRVAGDELERDFEYVDTADETNGAVKFFVRNPSVNIFQNPQHGRFGNEIFQYFMAARLAEHHGLTLRAAPWAGATLFGLSTSPLERKLPVIAEHDPRPDKSAIWQSFSPGAERVANVALFGDFQFDTGLYDGCGQELFRNLFSPCKPLHAALEAAKVKMMAGYETLVCVHVRRGDYRDNAPGMFYRTPVDSYVKWLRKIWPLLKSPKLYVASDDPHVVTEFSDAGFVPYTAKDVDIQLDEPFYVDFWMMTQANALAISNSSFSFAAAMLNENCLAIPTKAFADLKELPNGDVPLQLFFRPLQNGDMRPFDPWYDEILIGRHDAPVFGTAEQQTDLHLLELLRTIDPEKKGAFVELGLGTFAWSFMGFSPLGYTCYAVEPLPTPELIQACSAYATSLVQAAISDNDGFGTIYHGADPNLNSLDPEWWGADKAATSKQTAVAMMTLPTLFHRSNIAKCSVMKVDVEGEECKVFRTLAGMPTENLPAIIAFEYGGTDRKDGQGGWTQKGLDNTRECLSRMDQYGYHKLIVIENHRQPKIVDLTPEALNGDGWADVFFDQDATYGNIIAIKGTPPITSPAPPAR